MNYDTFLRRHTQGSNIGKIGTDSRISDWTVSWQPAGANLSGSLSLLVIVVTTDVANVPLIWVMWTPLCQQQNCDFSSLGGRDSFGHHVAILQRVLNWWQRDNRSPTYSLCKNNHMNSLVSRGGDPIVFPYASDYRLCISFSYKLNLWDLYISDSSISLHQQWSTLSWHNEFLLYHILQKLE